MGIDKLDNELNKIKPTPSSAIALFDLEHKKIIHFVHKDLVLSDASEAMKIIDDYSNEYKKNGDKTGLLVINKLKSEENLLESYQNIISCSQYKSLPENTLQEITKYFNTLKNS